MKTRTVDTITSDEEHVRLKIYEGTIPLGEAGAELLRLALAIHHRVDNDRRTLALHLERLTSVIDTTAVSLAARPPRLAARWNRVTTGRRR